MQSENRLRLRRTVLFGTPLLYIVLGIIHPMEDPGLGDPTSVFIGLHFAQMFLIAGLAYSLWLLVDGLESRAATVTRALILPFVILYTTLDAIAGLGMGDLVRMANESSAAEQATLGPFIEELREPDVGGYVIYLGAGLSWFAAVVAAVIAQKRRGPRGAFVLMALGALIFAVGHPKPTGPIGMSLFLAGVVWLELRPRREEAGHATSLQGA
jgi:cytochrome bd-type quinol oxidase subunit 2